MKDERTKGDIWKDRETDVHTIYRDGVSDGREARDGQVTPSHHCELLCLPHLGHVEELEVWPRGFFVGEDVVVVLLPPLARSVVVENLLSAAHATGHLVLHSLLRDCIAWCGVENKDDTCQRWGLARAMVGVGQQGLDVEHKG